MSKKVCAGAMLKCSCGAAPSVLNILPQNRTINNGVPTANIMDNKPMLNVPPFGVCNSLANPAVAAATAAACGVLTPMPCVPVLPGPWIKGASQELVANMPALTDDSKLMCAWAGVIEPTVAGQFTVEVS